MEGAEAAPQRQAPWWVHIGPAVRTGWWVILLAAALAAGIALFTLSRLPIVYEAESQYLIAPASTLDEPYVLVDAVSQLERPSTRAALAQLMQSTSVTGPALRTAGVTEAQADQYVIEVVPSATTSIVDLVVTGPDADAVGAVAGAVTAGSVPVFAGIFRVYEVQVLTPPPAQGEAVARGLPERTVAAAALGAALGFGLVLLRRMRLAASLVALRRMRLGVERQQDEADRPSSLDGTRPPATDRKAASAATEHRPPVPRDDAPLKG